MKIKEVSGKSWISSYTLRNHESEEARRKNSKDNLMWLEIVNCLKRIQVCIEKIDKKIV